MGLELREALRRLCVDIGWSYAVFWRMIGSPTPKHLVWEDGHWCGKSQLSRHDEVSSYMNLSAELGAQGDGNIDELVRKTMVPQVHLIGDGIIGHAASIGYHQWIVREANCDRESILLHLAELKNQFVLGIQTIVILPLIPYGVLQFGSTMRVMENNLFVNHVRASFMQLLCEPVSFGVIHESLGRSNLQYASKCSAVSSNQNSNDCSSIDKSFSMICNHQLSISSASRSLNHISAPLSTRCHENQLKLDAQRLSTMKIVGSSLLSTEPSNPMIYPSGNSLSHLNNRLQSGLVEAQVISNRDTMLASSRATHSTDCLYFLEENLSSAYGSRTQEPAVSIKASLEGMVGGLDTCSLHPKTEYLDYERVFSSQAGSKENFESSFCDALVFNSLNVSQDINASDINLGISRNSLANNSSINKCNGNPGPGNLKQKHDFPVSFGLTSRSCYRNVQETKPDSCNFEKLQNRRIEIDSSILHLPNENSSPFIPLTSSGDDLFDVLGFYDSLGKGSSIDQNLSVDDTSCNTQSNLLPIFYSLNDNWPEIYSESNTNDQLLDAVVSKINPGARSSLNENISCTTSATKVNGSPKYCGTSSNDGSASSGKKRGEYASPSILTCNSEVATSTSIRSADSMHETDRSGCYKSQISLWVESGQNTKSDSHIKRADEAIKINRKRSRPGDSPRPRPKDRQLIMDRVKELREIVPNGAKCSIDALLEKTIKHMLFLQSVAKHADNLKDSGEPKIICKDGGILLKDNFQGGATWAFEVGSQPITCPIIVEDLNPPREMLVEMLCEERGVFLEIADLIRGLGLTILKGVMEARKSKIWARFVVEANRDVTRMEIFLSLVRSLEPTFGCSSAAQYPAHNSSLPHKIFNPSCRVPVAGASDPLH